MSEDTALDPYNYTAPDAESPDPDAEFWAELAKTMPGYVPDVLEGEEPEG